ncbi:MAG: TadE/TadG family type IV pilus assembly protein [Sulfitobacter sp.]
MFSKLTKPLSASRFARREEGSVAVETMIFLPLLFWVFLSMYSLFDAFSQYSANQRAAFTIADLISRETAGVDDEYLDGAQDLLDYLTVSVGVPALRVSVLRWDEESNEMKLDWSKTRGWVGEHTGANIADWAENLPLMQDDETLLVVETWSNYDPPFATGLEARQIENFIFTRPRYSSQIAWLD